MSVEHRAESIAGDGKENELHEKRVHERSITEESMHLADSYGKDRLIFLVRDPQTLFATWEVSAHSIHQCKQRFENQKENARLTLRIFVWNAHNTVPNILTDIDVEGAHQWYVHHEQAGSICRAVLGVKCGDDFFHIVESTPVQIPLGRESTVTDTEWTSIEAILERSRRGQYKQSSQFL